MTETALSFDCGGDALVGILHRPSRPRRRGVVIVVGGGPQYRAGGHRQLTLWSRTLCEQGYPVLRFDYRGMGDSHGDFRGFTDVDDDIRSAVDRLTAEDPQIDEIVLWGECDAASAILLYAYRDPRVKGVVLLNPWVRTEAVAAKAIIRFYYLQRLMQFSFWKKLLGGSFDFAASARSARALLRQSQQSVGAADQAAHDRNAPISRQLPLTDSLLIGLSRFSGAVMLVLSGRDLIAREFDVLLKGSPAWQQAMERAAVTRFDMAEGDHTFSSATQRRQVVGWGLDWLRGW
ncbi:MAG: hydrolase 1, exosortase A system-associated [Rhizobacter sp.]